MNKQSYHRWTDEEKAFLTENFQLYTCQEFAEKMKITLHGVKKMRSELGLKKTKESLAKIYQRPNAGHFKTGSLPHNTLQDDEITLRMDKNGTLYKWIRLSLSKWEMLHVNVWKRAGNEIPLGYIVTFKDGDPTNCALSNLEMMTMAENLVRNRKRFLDEKHIKSQAALLNGFKLSVNRKEKRIAKQAIVVDKLSAKKEKRKLAEKERRSFIRSEKKAKAKKLKEMTKIISRKITPAKHLPKKEASKFQTRVVDYNEMISVRIDRRTTVYVKPGTDIDAIKLKYTKTA